VDTALFPVLIQHLKAKQLPALADAVGDYLGARAALRRMWPDTSAHWATIDSRQPPRLAGAMEALDRTKDAVLVLCPGLPQEWRKDPPVDDRAVLDDPAEAGLTAFLAFLREPRPPRKRRRGVRYKTRKVTALQTRAVELYGELNGNFKAIGDELGVSASTARKHFNRAITKMPELLESARKRARAREQKLPEDRRGQFDLDADGKLTPRTRIERDHSADDATG
jgi:hypothetical protein